MSFLFSLTEAVTKLTDDLAMSHSGLCSGSSEEINLLSLTLKDLLTLFLACFLFLVGQLCFLIRQRVSLRPEEALFFFVNNSLPPSSSPLSAVYEVTTLLAPTSSQEDPS